MLFRSRQSNSHLNRVLSCFPQRSTALLFSALLTVSMAVSRVSLAETHDVQIGNGLIHATIHPPDPVGGFYHGTRFDWSGIIGSLTYDGHDYYGPWFTRSDPTVRDYIYDGPDIVAGPCSAVTGPAEEFLTNGEALGFSEASPGGTFIKIGVGVLRKPDDAEYSIFRLYDIADFGKWSVRAKPESVEFTQRVLDPSSGYGYLYRKIVRLVHGKPQMIIEHHLTNIGKRSIATSVYDHNFLVLDNQTVGPDFTVTLPFEIHPAKPVKSAFGAVDGKKIHYAKELQGHDLFGVKIEGFGKTSRDYEITIENAHVGAGMKVKGDHPLESEELWSIRSTLAMEPYIHMSIEPGKTAAWKYTYTYYSIPK